MAVPEKDSLLVPYSTNWNTRLSTNYADFDLTEAEATAYSHVHSPYIAAVTAMNTARADGTRAKSMTETRNTTKAALLAYARQLYATVQANADVTDANKTLLGIHIRSGGNTPVPAPVVRPGMEVVAAAQRTVTVRVFDSASTKKVGKPAGSVQAYIYTFVGTDYPSDPSLWQFNGACTKATYDITFGSEVPSGAQVWVCAAWVNRKGETGPTSVPVTTNVQGGGASSEGSMKIAA